MTHRNHHEREFEAFLAGEESELARLYRRLPQSEPDARLDASVLAMARAAVEPQRVNALRHAKTRTRRPWWLVGLSSAAGVVLAAGVAWQMRNAFHDTLPGATSPAVSPAARAEREVVPISAIVPPPEPAAPPEPPPAAPAASRAPPAATPAQATTAAAAAAAPAPAKPAPPPTARTAAHRREVEVISADAADSKDKSLRFEAPPPAAPPPPDAFAEAAPAAPPASEPAANAGGATPAGAGSAGASAQVQAFPGNVPDYNSVERKAAIASGTRRDDYGLSAEAAASDPLAKREQRTRANRQIAREQPAPQLRAEKPAVLGNSSRPPAKLHEAAPLAKAAPPVATETAPPVAAEAVAPGAAAPSAAAAADSAAELQRNARLKPEEWVGKIRDLLRAQRRADALENLALLRRTHPDYVLPEDLRGLR